MKQVQIQVAREDHSIHAETICEMIQEAARLRGTGIAKRSPEYIISKMEQGRAVIALEGQNVAGFCYIETWSHGNYVAHSGLIVHEDYRGLGLAKKIKTRAFELSREKFPQAKIFGLTTSLPVMKINSELGYKPVTFSELTQDEEFWKGCQSCVNYDVLTRTNKKHCLCTGMLYDGKAKEKENTQDQNWPRPLNVYARWIRFKSHVLTHFRERRQKKQEIKKFNLKTRPTRWKRTKVKLY